MISIIFLVNRENELPSGPPAVLLAVLRGAFLTAVPAEGGSFVIESNASPSIHSRIIFESVDLGTVRRLLNDSRIHISSVTLQ